MAENLIFRDYLPADKHQCLAMFDANCPEFFAPNERQDYQVYLESGPEGYELCVASSGIVGAFGLSSLTDGAASLNWILLNPEAQGLGTGTKIMGRVLNLAASSGAKSIHIAASHKSAPFFKKFGAAAYELTEDGWGPGMHRVDMELTLGQF